MKAATRGALLFAVGAVLMSGAVVLGKFFLPEAQHGVVPMTELLHLPKFILFAFGFPLGVGLALWGAALGGGADGRRALLFGAAAAVGPVVMLAIPVVAGVADSPVYFGVGGVTLLLLILLTLAGWGFYRSRLPRTVRSAGDLQAVGYCCFALAAWTVCGVGGMPGFALYPDRMQQLQTHFMAIVNLKAAMAFFILGWLFTLLSFYHTGRRRQENSDHHGENRPGCN